MKPTIVFLVAHPMSVRAFLLPHIYALSNSFEIRILANIANGKDGSEHALGVHIEPVPILRRISIFADFKALWVLYFRFKKRGLFAVHTITPKAGLLGMLSAFLAGVPVRVHCFTGQVWATHRGPMRWLLKAADMCIAALATDILVDSRSQYDFLIRQGVLKPDFGRVLGAGSICGVNTQRFIPNSINRERVRNELGSPSDSIVCLYLGRLNYDKGLLDLATAFANAAESCPNAELWIIGPDEGMVFGKMQLILENKCDRVKRLGYTETPEHYMQAADLFCLPSYREGFGSSVIEAAACGLPTLASRIYGLADAVLDGRTGWFFRVGDVEDLTEKLNILLANKTELAIKGKNARDYVKNVFDEKIITESMVQFYKRRSYEAGF